MTSNPIINTHRRNKQLIVFVKTPIPGLCKTRLIPFLTAEQACEFYKKLVINCFNKMKNLNDIDLTIYTYPDITHTFIKRLSYNYSTTIHEQKGNDLGERMFNAMTLSLQAYDQSVLIGTDCPVLEPSYIDKAFKALNQHDMVLGPAKDGGYVLIGATKVEASLFQNINWGTASVLQQSLINSEYAGYTTHLLNTLWDIDEPRDYIEYQSLLNATKNQTRDTGITNG